MSSLTPISTSNPALTAIALIPAKTKPLLTQIPNEVFFKIVEMLGAKDSTLFHGINKKFSKHYEDHFYGVRDFATKAIAKQYSEETRKNKAALDAAKENYEKDCHSCSNYSHVGWDIRPSAVGQTIQTLFNKYREKEDLLLPSSPAYRRAMENKKVIHRIAYMCGGQKKFDALPEIPKDQVVVTTTLSTTGSLAFPAEIESISISLEQMNAPIMRGFWGNYGLEFICLCVKVVEVGNEETATTWKTQTFYQRYTNSDEWESSSNDTAIFQCDGPLISYEDKLKNQKTRELLRQLIVTKKVQVMSRDKVYLYFLATREQDAKREHEKA